MTKKFIYKNEEFNSSSISVPVEYYSKLAYLEEKGLIALRLYLHFLYQSLAEWNGIKIEKKENYCESLNISLEEYDKAIVLLVGNNIISMNGHCITFK